MCTHISRCIYIHLITFLLSALYHNLKCHVNVKHDQTFQNRIWLNTPLGEICQKEFVCVPVLIEDTDDRDVAQLGQQQESLY